MKNKNKEKKIDRDIEEINYETKLVLLNWIERVTTGKIHYESEIMILPEIVKALLEN